jgi:hypothetical protein
MTDDWTAYLLLCTGGLVVAMLIIGRRRIFNRFHFAALFLGLMYITYVVRPVLAYWSGTGLSFLDFYLNGASVLVARDIGPLALAFSGAVIFFALGYRWLNRATLQADTVKPISNPSADKAYRRYALFLIVVGYASFLFAKRGFLPTDSTIEYARYAGGTVYANTTGYLEFANYLVPAGAILYFASTKALLRSLVLAAPWFANLLLFGYARYMFLNLGVGLLVVGFVEFAGAGMGRRTQALLATLVVAALLLLLAMRGDRQFLQSGNSAIDAFNTTFSQPVDSALGDFAGFEGTWYTIHTLDTFTPRYGTGIIYNLVFQQIPRIVWADKPLGVQFTWGGILGTEDTSVWQGSMAATSDSIWFNTAVKGSIGYALEEWGWLGIAVNFFLTGLFFGWVEKRFAASSHSAAWVAFYASVYGFIIMQGRNALFDYLNIYFLAFFLPYWIGQYWVRRSESRRRYLEGTGIRAERPVHSTTGTSKEWPVKS